MNLRSRLFREGEGNDTVEINPINLIDVLFVIIIFLVLTNTMSQDTSVEVKKPSAASASQVKDKTLKLAITREGTVHIFDKQVDLNVLAEILKRESERQPGLNVVIVADDASLTGSLIKVIDKCNLAGVKNVSVAALNEN
ncbi:MAG: biopolymer transporter ExbD [Spirochaetes bacterium]|nr:biopolymer transporter ExbD [Spirochaetota bacterium]